MLNASVIRELVAAGLSGDELVAACERIEAANAKPRAMTNAERQAKFRASRNESNEVTLRRYDPSLEVSEVSPIPPSNLPKPFPKKTPKGVQKGVSENFEILWAAYPRRDGANPKEPARKAYISAIQSGVEHSDIAAGVERYAADEQRRNHIGTPYVAQFVTWLRQRRWVSEEQPKAQSPPQLQQVFVVEGSDAWREWCDYRRKIGANKPFVCPESANNGFRRGNWFPSEYPPKTESSG